VQVGAESGTDAAAGAVAGIAAGTAGDAATVGAAVTAAALTGAGAVVGGAKAGRFDPRAARLEDGVAATRAIGAATADGGSTIADEDNEAGGFAPIAEELSTPAVATAGTVKGTEDG